MASARIVHDACASTVYRSMGPYTRCVMPDEFIMWNSRLLSVEGDNYHDEFDPDDLDGPSPSSAAIATAAAGAGGSSMVQRVRISAISDLKEFTGKDQDEDRARTWISKVKSALMRDQASDA
ncbi:hypothetical protein PInf_009794 [Phytophthora infestans]|nr:hypothetical protein PInf_009794 [Phytophthora infestans]